MKEQHSHLAGRDGFVLVYMALVITVLLLFSGLALDTGRAYVVKAQLSKAVDGAALAAARSVNSGDPRATAERILRANFPTGFLGTSSVSGPTFGSRVLEGTGVNVVTVSASAYCQRRS